MFGLTAGKTGAQGVCDVS